MFSWVGSQLDSALNVYVIGVVQSLTTAIAPVAVTTTTLWIMLYGWAVLRNEVSETLPAFLWKSFKLGLVLAVSLQSGVYISYVSDAANSLASGMATTFLFPNSAPTTIDSPYGVLDAFNDKASQLVVDLMKEAGITRLDLVFAAVVTAFGNVVFLCLALFVVTLAKIFLTFAIAVGPLFIFCLAWRPAARFFDSWLSMVINAVVLTWFAFFALGLSCFMGGALVQAIHNQGGFLGPTLNAVTESLRYCVVMILMAILCFQAPSLASALAGGTAIQQGVQMVQNVLMASRFRSSGAHPPALAAAPGGVVRAGTGLPYAAGRLAAGLTAGTGGGRRGTAPHRAPAYKLAALRARS